jgi:DNA-directed RNA polymerase subunit beta
MTIGRAKTYEAIVKETMPEPGLPESFNVLMHELKGLGLISD